ncbi:hypothetical protein V2J23_17300, partial [Geobacillus thermoleovorans]
MYIFKLLLSGHFPSSDITIPEHIVFLSLDPDPGDADDILTQNGYAYANNNPVMYVGPDGNKSKRNNPADTVLSATTALVSLVTALREMGIYFLRVSWHAAERMVERKVVSKMIAKAIKHGKVPWATFCPPPGHENPPFLPIMKSRRKQFNRTLY